MQTTEGGEFVDASGLYLRRGGVCPRFNLFFSFPAEYYLYGTVECKYSYRTRVYFSRASRLVTANKNKCSLRQRYFSCEIHRTVLCSVCVP